MEFEIACTCGQDMLVEDQYVGGEVECPGCGGLLMVPPRPVDEGDVPVVAPLASPANQTYVGSRQAPPPPPPPTPKDHPTDLGYGMPGEDVERVHPKAIIAVVLGVIGIVGCPIIPSIAALVLASQAKRDIQDHPGMYTGAGWATLAQVLGALPLLLLMLGLLAALMIPQLVPPD